MTFMLHSPVFLPNEPIPSRYTCEGNDCSPPRACMGEPSPTRSFALIVDDPDAPDPGAPKRTFVHWILYNIPPQVHTLKEGIGEENLPPGTRSALNDWGRPGYGGPCPPVGRHRYYFRLYALAMELADLGAVTRKEFDQEMRGHVLQEAVLMGTYKKTLT